VYKGNQVTVTDPANHSKTYTMDAFGNLTSVQESDPTNGLVTTSYTYDVMNHLISVSMPRGTATQTRTFNYAS
jgi:YD repeat-containing protein